MDEGRFIVAAAPGTVTQVQDGYFDRQVAWTGAPANFVKVQSSDGTEEWYWHMRKWSTMVSPGDVVVEGQPLGLVGSSGNALSPHIHFQVVNGGTVYDPSDGPCNVSTSLWEAHKPDVFTLPVTMWQNGITTVPPTVDSLKERPPDVTHVYQNGTVPYYFWVKLRDQHAGDVSLVLLKEPGGSTWGTASITYTNWCVNCSNWWQADLPDTGCEGTWTWEYYLNSTLQATRTFVLDTTPNASPVATPFSQSVVHGIVEGEMDGSDADSGIAWWVVTSPPAHGKVWFYGSRDRFYRYIPDAGFSGTDSFQFVVQDAQGDQSAPVASTFNVTAAPPNTLHGEGEFDGVSIPSSASLNIAGPLTIEGWVKREPGAAGYQTILDRRGPLGIGGAEGYSLLLSPDDKLRFTLGNGSGATILVGATRIRLSEWRHVAATWDGATMRVYVDGVLDGSLAFAGPISYADVTEGRIGYSLFTLTEGFRGEIDELQVWSVARTASKLQAGATCSFFESALPASVRARWPFNGNADDVSGNGNGGSLAGNATLFRANDSGVPLTCVTDLDGDSVADAMDDCPLDPDPGQVDSDMDGLGDACDLCPSQAGDGEYDIDLDGIGDACDNCPFQGNADQVDTDGDRAGDACEPAPSDNAVSVPGAAISVSVTHDLATGQSTVSWTAAPFSSSYEVVRGSRAELQSRFYGTCQNSRDGDTADTTFVDDQAPGSGDAYYYLVLGVAPDGTRGLAGVGSDGRQRDLRAKDCI